MSSRRPRPSRPACQRRPRRRRGARSGDCAPSARAGTPRLPPTSSSRTRAGSDERRRAWAAYRRCRASADRKDLPRTKMCSCSRRASSVHEVHGRWQRTRACCTFRATDVETRRCARMAIVETSLAGLTLHGRGKVRDIYDLGEHFLIVASDRLSAFDVVLPTPIPDKGKVLTQMSEFWFDYFKALVPHHLISTQLEDFPPEVRRHREQVQGRSMLVKKATVFPVECVVRGYLAGSGLKDYQKT